MRRRSSSSSSSVEARDRASVVEAGVSRGGRVAAQLDHELFGFPAGENGVDAAGCPAELVFQHGVGARAGLAHPVFDVGQGAHGELQAVGQVGAIAVAQCHAPTHNVVAEPFQRPLVHEGIMTHHGRQCRAAMPGFFHFSREEAEITSVAPLPDRL